MIQSMLLQIKINSCLLKTLETVDKVSKLINPTVTLTNV